MIKSMSAFPAAGSPLPSLGAMGQLFAGGVVGLMIWEVWARFITVIALGGPPEPAGLVTSLVQHWTGYQMPPRGRVGALRHRNRGLPRRLLRHLPLAPRLDVDARRRRLGELHQLRRLFAMARGSDDVHGRLLTRREGCHRGPFLQ